MDRVFRKVVGQNVKTFRRKLGLSQEEVAERADVHWTYVSGVERGRYNISLASLVKLAKALNRKPYELLK
ncbi:MAG: helix-turn-helix domain-containing protein [candidate division Zixibacteria bacterium]|nr:helix-turn-helix domain-containing protein [candidate division Zixibacteria bacterium]